MITKTKTANLIEFLNAGMSLLTLKEALDRSSNIMTKRGSIKYLIKILGFRWSFKGWINSSLLPCPSKKAKAIRATIKALRFFSSQKNT